MEICSVKEEQLPKLFESYEITGTLTEDAASQLGLTTACKIAAGDARHLCGIKAVCEFLNASRHSI